MQGRYKAIYAIGDIHGCNTELQLLLQKLPLSRDTLVVFLGDYIDRGAHSKQVVETILALRKTVPVVTLKGNHESLLMDFLDQPDSAGAGVFILNGGSATLVSYETEPGRFALPAEHEKFFRELRLNFETEDFYFVHAGVPELPLSQLDDVGHEAQMLWIRAPFLSSQFAWKKIVVHGHTPTREPDIRKNRINIDTGCVYNGHLTAIELPSKQIYSVEKQNKSEATVFLRDHSRSSRVAMRFNGALQVTIEKNAQILQFETLNYNQFGMLIRESAQSAAAKGPSLVIGENITGVVGTQNWVEMNFSGTVVRTETRSGDILYGVKVASLIAPGDTL